jgi:Protein of unknown function (DUF3485)
MKGKTGWVFGLALVLMVAASGFLVWMKAHQKLGRPGLKLDLPERVLEFRSELLAATPEEKQSLPQDTRIARRLYWNVEQGETNYAQISVVLMGADRTSIHKPEFCLVGQGWRIEQKERISLPIQRPHAYSLPVMKFLAAKNVRLERGDVVRGRAIYLFWFVADQALTADHGQRMWWMAKNLLTTGTLQRWAYVSCFSTCLPGQEEATLARMTRLLVAAVPEFQETTGSPPKAGSP